jgi:hypothetical protein
MAMSGKLGLTGQKTRVPDEIHFTYVYLYDMATYSRDQAEADEEGRFFNCMNAVVYSAFCVEAYLNHVGPRVLPCWDKEDCGIDKLSPQAKLCLICDRLGLTLDISRQPFQSFRSIFKFRNLIAHARPGDFVSVQEMCTVKVANEVVAAARAMAKAIHLAAGLGRTPFVIRGMSGFRKRLKTAP